uniref:Ubiquinone biosynthesis protein COQ4 homolog, mitochondrial n=1 Tax=Strigamia maritima TaxID=126957 RepID=T1IUR3_STRMM
MAVKVLNSCRYFHLNKLNLSCVRKLAASSTSKEDEPKFSIDESKIHAKVMYDGHIPTTSFQKILLAVGSAGMALYKPQRDDMVAVMGEATGIRALKKIHTKMTQEAEGQMILREKPRINSQTVDLNYLKTLPKSTLGGSYIKFLDDNKVSPDTRMDVQFVDDAELAYVMQRYREMHDLVHTLLNMPTNMLGEVAVKWVEGIQTGLPMCTLGALFGPLRFAPKQRRKYLVVLPWAIRCGYQSRFLMNIYFEKRWEQPIDVIRKEMNIEPPPSIL